MSTEYADSCRCEMQWINQSCLHPISILDDATTTHCTHGRALANYPSSFPFILVSNFYLILRGIFFLDFRFHPT